MKLVQGILVLVFLTMTLCAQQDESAAPVRVARLSYFSGAVRVERADNTGDPSGQPVANMPIGDGSRIAVSDYAQAELEFEDGSVVRITPRSTLLVDSLTLEGGVAQSHLTLLNGLIYLELRKSPGFSYAVSAGGVVMSPVENFTVRISLEDGPAIFSVLSGTVRVERGFSADVRAGESLHADPADDSRYFLVAQVPVESWDSWNAERDRGALNQVASATSVRDGYAGVQGYGWSDLDSNGTWYDVPGEGEVWQPAAADEEFDPYGFGSWVWQGSGYAWASGYSWGWVTYRCGHWSYFAGFGWGWQADGGCGRWGARSGGVLVGKRRPPHYQPVSIPVRALGVAHPAIPVRDQNGPRPALLPGGVKLVHGAEWKPVPQLGLVPVEGGSSLTRDYPVNGKTRSPVLGVVPKGEGVVVGRAPVTADQWREREGRRRIGGEIVSQGRSGDAVSQPSQPTGSAGGSEGVRAGGSGVAVRPQPIRGGPVQGDPAKIAAPRSAPAVPTAPVAPGNGRQPMSQPAPVSVPASRPSPPPSAPAPQSAPVHTGQTKPQ